MFSLRFEFGGSFIYYLQVSCVMSEQFKVIHCDCRFDRSIVVRRLLGLAFEESNHVVYKDVSSQFKDSPMGIAGFLETSLHKYNMLVVHPGVNAQEQLVHVVEQQGDLEVILFTPGMFIDYQIAPKFRCFAYRDAIKLVGYISQAAQQKIGHL